MFSQPREYLEKFQKVMSFELKGEYLARYMEIKASRDLIVHGTGEINAVYVSKAGALSRGQVGDELPVDAAYFDYVVSALKRLSGSIVSGTAKKYG